MISEQNVTSSSCANSFLTIDNLTSSTEHSSFSDIIINNKTFEVENVLRTYESIDEQITNYRNTNHNHYIEEKLQNNIKKSENNNDHVPKRITHVTNHDSERRNNDVEFNRKNKWPKNTILCASDFMMNQIDESRLSKG